jgi:hypothetical protein
MTITESAQKRLVAHAPGKIRPHSLVGGLLRFITPQGSEHQLTTQGNYHYGRAKRAKKSLMITIASEINCMILLKPIPKLSDARRKPYPHYKFP